MKTTSLTTGLAAVLCVTAAGTAHAHTGLGSTGGFMLGFAHPLGGLDHVLALTMVGLFAAQLGGRAVWLVPATFIATMMIGGILGMAGIAVPFIELGIGLSVLVLGGIVALQMRPSVSIAMMLAATFAVFHGHAHGAEMPQNAAGLAYGVGFVTAGALLLAFGIGLQRAIDTAFGKAGLMMVRSVGAGVAAIGLGAVSGIL